MGGLATFLKAVLALALVGGATTAVVAPAYDMASARNAQRAASFGKAPSANQTPGPDRTYPPQVDYEALLRACLDSRDPDSEACMNAQSESGMSPDAFRAKIVAKLASPSPETATPKPTQAPEFGALFEQCLVTRDVNSDACQRAYEASGMTPKDFEEKFYAKLEAKDQAAKATPKTEGDFWTWFDKCLATRDLHSDACVKSQALIGFNDADFKAKFERYLAERDSAEFAKYFDKCLGIRDLGSEYCKRAYELSHMSRADFEQKYNAKLAAKDGGDFWAWFDKCLATRNIQSDPCVKAQALIGFNDADFQAKFARYLAERDAKSAKPSATPTPKPTATPKPTTAPSPSVWSAYVDLLVKECQLKYAIATGNPGSTDAITAAGEACQKAITATGLSPHDFWTKFGVTPKS